MTIDTRKLLSEIRSDALWICDMAKDERLPGTEARASNIADNAKTILDYLHEVESSSARGNRT